MANRRRYRYSIKRVAIAIAALVGIVFAFIYLLFSIYFQSHFFWGTTINGKDCSGKSIAATEDLLKNDTRYYVLKLIERDNVVEHISAEDMGMSVSLGDSVAKLKQSQNPFGWLFAGDKNYTINISVIPNQELLQKRIDSLNCMKDENMREPSSPTLIYEDGVYSVKPGDAGTKLDKEKLTGLIKQAVDNRLESINLDKSGCYINEYVDETSKLYQLESTLNTYLMAKIDLEFGEDTETIERSLISQWISLSETSEIVFDEKAIYNYIASLAKKYETFGTTREFVNSYGKTVIVKGGDYGWWFNKTAEVQNIITDIKAGKSIRREIEYLQKAAVHGETDIGKTYCEISLSKQKLFLYKDGVNILTADIISGTDNTKYETPTGTYKLRYKQKSYTFKRSYFNRSVKYWMVFYGSSADDTIGLVAADWLTSFGGSIYKTKGSYGSIYMSKEDAYKVYQNLPNDSAIVIYN